MNTNYDKLGTIAAEVLTEEARARVIELIEEGTLDGVKEYLLLGIDISWNQGALSFDDAAELYKLLDLPSEQACAFRQKNLGVFYS